MFRKDKALFFVILFVALYIAMFTYLSILRYKSFFSYEWEDQATHHQLLWNTAHGRPFYNSIGISGYYFSYHFQPIILFQALFYRIWPHIYNFLFGISFALGIGALPLYLIAKKIFRSSLSAFFISLSYLLYAPLHNVNFCDGDPVIITIPLLFFILLILELNNFNFNQRTLSNFAIISLFVLMCKEHIGFTIMLFGIYFMFARRKEWGLSCLIISIAWLAISLPITFRLNHGQSLARSIDYSSFAELMLYPFIKPIDFLKTSFSINHLRYLFKIFMPLSFLPLFSALSYVPAVDLMLLILQKGNIKFYQAYYIAPVIPFLFVGLVHAIKRISLFITPALHFKKSEEIIFLISLLVFLLNVSNLFRDNILGNITEGKIIYDERFMNTKNMFDSMFYIADEEDRLAWSFISMVPKDASVSVTGDLLPALSSRTNLRELFNQDYDYLDADYVLFHTRYLGFGGGDYCKVDDDTINLLINKMKIEPRWLKLREEGNFVLFKRKQL